MKKKIVIWSTIFLSLSLIPLSSVVSDAKEETKPIVENVRVIESLNSVQNEHLGSALSQVMLWNDTIFYNNLTKQATKSTKRYTSYSGPAIYGTGACGGDLPPCSVMMCENGGKITGTGMTNPRVSGKWQIHDGTWDGYGGYESAEDAPESVQDEKAALIYDGGAGRGQWEC